jgi:two-component system sensor histidine kinase VicK
MEDIETLKVQLAASLEREKELERQLALIPQQMEESAARLTMAMESVQMGTWDYKPQIDELIWSNQCRKIYGISLEEKVSFDLFVSLIHEEDKIFVIQEIEKALHSPDNGLYDVTFRILRFDDGEPRWIRSQGKVYFKGQKAEHFIGTIIDITDHKLAQEKSARLVAIIETSDDAIISKTLDGIITSWNESARRTFGYTEDEIIGQSILRLIPPDRQDEEPHILSRLRRGERVEHFETKRMTKDGRLLDISLTISPVINTEGKIIGLSKIARDITERKQEELRKNDFIAMVSHELKTPLTSMKSYLQVLLAKAKKEGDEFTINALTRADVQAKKMTVMIQDFLSLARLEEGKISLHKEIFTLHPVIEETASDAQYLSSNHNIVLQDCEDIMLYADRDKIGQILMNLLSNAIKYSPKGGTIIIGCEKQPGKVKIYVRDEGVGISETDQKRLFERFYRSKNEKIKTVSGFGIGLYLVSEILRYHNSHIEVESEEGVGSVFYFSLNTEAN